MPTTFRSMPGAALALVRFLPETRTVAGGGENRGRELRNRRVATGVEPLGRVGDDGSPTARAAAPRRADLL